MVLDLQLGEGLGVPNDSARPHHPMTLTNAPTWGKVPTSTLGAIGITNGLSQNIRCAGASSTDLNFTSGAFSIVFWVIGNWGLQPWLISRGDLSVNGWILGGRSDYYRFWTSQAGNSQTTTTSGAGNIPTGWHLVGVVRNGTSVRIYVNAVDWTTSPGVHTNPLTSNLDLIIGSNLCISAYFSEVRIWGRNLSPQEIQYIFNKERHYFGV